MNRVYRIVFNAALGLWQVVGELAKNKQKSHARGLQRVIVLASLGSTSGLVYSDLPSGGSIVSGSGSISQSGNSLNIQQNSNQLISNWQSFDIGAGQSVNFIQPSQSAVALNRVLGNDASQIFGSLNANGRVFLINPNGVLFGQGASVNVGSLVASTLDISDSDFLSGHYRFSGKGGTVRNQGNLRAAEGGAIALLGGKVSNSGVIEARLGSVALAAGGKVALDFAGDGLLSVKVDEAALDALVENQGAIRADGGSVLLTADAGEALLQTVVNNSGVVQAQTLANRDGKIVLLGGFDGGTVQVAGTLDASAFDAGDGGFIETSGAHVKVADGTHITTRAENGQNGKWLIDPTDFTVAKTGGDMTGTALTNALANGDVEIQSTMGAGGVNGDVNIKDRVSWSQNTLTLNAQRDINVFSTINASGTAGLFFKYNQADAGGSYNIYAPVNLASTSSFRTQSGSAGGITNWTIITSLGSETDVTGNTGTTLQGIWGNLGGNYVLGTDIDASATASWNGGLGFTPLGGNDPGASNNPQFTGNFDGLGHVIDSLTINRPAYYNIGLFGSAFDGVIANIGLTHASITGNTTVGGLAGRTGNLTIRNSYVSGAITGNGAVGGIVGVDIFPRGSDVLDHVWSAGSVTATAASTGTATLSGIAGGLIGHNAGEIRYSYSTADVRGGNYVGGLVGSRLFGSIDNSYFAGTIGSNGVAGSDGTVKAPYAMGALVGSLYTADGVVSKSYWNTDTAGAVGAGSVYIVGSGAFNGVGLTTAQMRNAANWTGFNFVTTPSQNGWVLLDGVLPMLAAEWSPYIRNAHQLQLMALDLSADYRLANDIDASATNGKDVWYGGSFAPVGRDPDYNNYNPALRFRGIFDGQYHVIRDLHIDMSTGVNNGMAGLFGSIGSGAVVRRVGLVNPVVKLTGTTDWGYYQAGALAGENRGQIEESFALNADIRTSSVAANTHGFSGGLVGWNETGSTVTQSYATGTVQATAQQNAEAGGLLGRNNSVATLSQSWAAVTATATAGTTAAGGLVGQNWSDATISNSIWDTSLMAVGIGAAGVGDVTGLDATQMTNIANFTSWGADISANGGESCVWRIYDGHTAPLLRGFMQGVTLDTSITGGNKTYDGQVASGNVSYSSAGPIDSSQIHGNLNYVSNSANAGAYSLGTGNLSFSDTLYSGQLGYDISYSGNPSLNIAKADATVTANSRTVTYNGTVQSVTGYSVDGLVNGEDASVLDSLVEAGGSGRNAGSYTHSLSGSDNNYNLSFVDGSLTIEQAALTVSTTDVTKTYDGSTSANGSAIVTGGTLYGSDSLSGGDFAFLDKNAGTGKTVTVSGVTVNDGNGGGNYVISYTDNTGSTITKAALTVTASDDSKPRDAYPYAGGSGVTYSGFITGEDASVLAGTLSYGGSAQGATNEGNYVISVTGFSSDNYSIEYVDGVLNIHAGQMTAQLLDAYLTALSAQAAAKQDDKMLSIQPIIELALVGDGIRAGLPLLALPSEPQPSTPEQMAANLQRVLPPKGSLLFDINDANLAKEQANTLLKTLVAYLTQHPDARVRVVGYADDRGSAAYNDALSLRRAEAVQSLLLQLGVNPDQMEVEGAGFRDPLLSNASAQGRARNRRVDLLLP